MKRLALTTNVLVAGFALVYSERCFAISPTPEGVLEDAKQAVSGLTHLLEALGQVSLEANVTFEPLAIDEPGVDPEAVINGSFTFIASGLAWRKRSLADTTEYPGMNTDIAYDGSTFYYATPEHGTLAMALNGDDQRPKGMSFPNPLYGMSLVFTPIGPDASGDDVTLASLRDYASGFDISEGTWRESIDGTSIIGVFPGGSLDLLEVENHFIYSGPGEPIVVERKLAVNDAILMRVQLEDWQAHVIGGTPHDVPRTVIFEGIDPATGEVGARATMSLTTFVGEGLSFPPGAFSIPLDSAERVWLDDTGSFIR